MTETLDALVNQVLLPLARDPNFKLVPRFSGSPTFGFHILFDLEDGRKLCISTILSHDETHLQFCADISLNDKVSRGDSLGLVEGEMIVAWVRKRFCEGRK